jgi:hypothetical protein
MGPWWTVTLSPKRIQTASSDFKLVDGVLVPRVTSQKAKRIDEGDSQLPIVTAIKTVFLNMSTTRLGKELAAISTLDPYHRFDGRHQRHPFCGGRRGGGAVSQRYGGGGGQGGLKV